MMQQSSLSSTWETWKPRVVALAIGLVAGPLISNSLGWQVTSGAARTAMRDGVVQSQALICEAQARADVKEPGKLDYSGRSDLAKKWAVMPGAKDADSEVANACAGRLAG